ncbi:MAG: hypothetical protein AB7S36_10435 [Planctomycetota bacterium]
MYEWPPDIDDPTGGVIKPRHAPLIDAAGAAGASATASISHLPHFPIMCSLPGEGDQSGTASELVVLIDGAIDGAIDTAINPTPLDPAEESSCSSSSSSSRLYTGDIRRSPKTRARVRRAPLVPDPLDSFFEIAMQLPVVCLPNLPARGASLISSSSTSMITPGQLRRRSRSRGRRGDASGSQLLARAAAAAASASASRMVQACPASASDSVDLAHGRMHTPAPPTTPTPGPAPAPLPGSSRKRTTVRLPGMQPRRERPAPPPA